VTLRVPKFVNGVRPNLPDFSPEATEDGEAGPGVDTGINGSRSGVLPAAGSSS
jgi:two-component system LytT family sensor kinase